MMGIYSDAWRVYAPPEEIDKTIEPGSNPNPVTDVVAEVKIEEPQKASGKLFKFVAISFGTYKLLRLFV